MQCNTNGLERLDSTRSGKKAVKDVLEVFKLAAQTPPGSSWATCSRIRTKMTVRPVAEPEVVSSLTAVAPELEARLVGVVLGEEGDAVSSVVVSLYSLQ